MTWMGGMGWGWVQVRGMPKMQRIYAYIQLIHDVQQKLTVHCKAIIFQLKRGKKIFLIPGTVSMKSSAPAFYLMKKHHICESRQHQIDLFFLSPRHLLNVLLKKRKSLIQFLKATPILHIYGVNSSQSLSKDL